MLDQPLPPQFVPTAAVRMGRRQQNKADKLNRIKQAARQAFLLNGYDEATTREIARRAKVALGTLFLYAANKRDLLFLTVNDEYAAIAERAALAIREDRALLDNLLTAFGLLYEFFAENPKLSQLVLREMQFYESGTQAERFAATRDRMIALSSRAVRHAQRARQIQARANADDVGRVIFSVYQSEVRRWLGKEPLRMRTGLKELEQALRIVIEGLSPTPRAFATKKRPRPKRSGTRR